MLLRYMAEMEFFCGCLNVRVSFENGNIRKVTQNEFKNEDYVIVRDAYVLENIEGLKITTKLDCLCDKQTIGDLVISNCINCETTTLVVSHKEPLTYFITKEMLRASQAVLLKELPNYSSIFEIVLLEPTLNSDINDNVQNVSLLSQFRVKDLTLVTTEKVNVENELMNDRIRKFELEEHDKFSIFQRKAQRDQEALKRVIISFFNKMPETEKVNICDIINVQQNLTPKYSTESRNPGAEAVLSSKQQSLKFTAAHDTVFSMDEDSLEEFGNCGEQNNEIEDVYEEIDVIDFDSSNDGDAFLPLDNKIYATSLPIAMPMRIKSPSHPDDLDNPLLEGEFEKVEDPQWMAASIQALAMSVRRSDGTEMFGARPRPRLNTLD